MRCVPMCFICCGVAALFSTRAMAWPQYSGIRETRALGDIAAGREADIHGEISGEFVSRLLLQTQPGLNLTHYGIKLSRATIAGRVDAINADVPAEITFSACTFEGPVRLETSVFRKNLNLRSCVFRRVAAFGGMIVQGNLRLEPLRHPGNAPPVMTSFTAGVMFNDIHLTGSLIAPHTSFKASDDWPSIRFDSAQVDGRVDCSGDDFWGDVDFTGARIGSGFDLASAQFTFRRHGDVLVLNSITVGGLLKLNEAKIHCNVDLRRAKINSNFSAVGTEFEHVSGLPLQVADFRGMTVGGTVALTGAQFDSLDIDDMTYSSFLAGSDEKGDQRWGAVLDLAAKNRPYSRDVYRRLEDYFNRIGQTKLADDTYIEGRRRQRAEGVEPALWWLRSVLADYLVRYMRAPLRVFLASIAVVVIGWLVFLPAGAVEPRAGDAKTIPQFNALWFSLESFIPVVKLDTAEHWRPKLDARYRWFYLRCHRIIGWILVPLMVVNPSQASQGRATGSISSKG